MIVAPAVDLKGGRCVQLVGGQPGTEKVSLPDPVAVARDWAEKGFGTLHLVDLDAALGSGDNRKTLLRASEATPAATQAGGGIRSDEVARTLLDGGVNRIIVGTRAITDRPWLNRLARLWPSRVMVAADLKDGRIVRKGWTESTPIRAEAFLSTLGDLPLAGALCTDVGREGRLGGIDPDSVRALIRASSVPVWISGGITTMEDLEFLASEGAAGAVLGMSIYTGALDVGAVAKAWGR